MRGCTIAAATFVIALLAATLATAAPQLKQKNKGVAIPLTNRNYSTFLHPNNTVNFATIDAHAASVSAKIVRGLDNYEVNTGMMHPSVLEQRGPRKRDGGVALTRYWHLFWHGTLSIGSPPKEFNVEIDTGAADFFVRAASEGAIAQEHTVWDPSSSSTSNDLNLPFKVLFANKDNALGKQYTDNVTIGGFTADKQTVGAATTFIFLGQSVSPVDGVLGLAFQSVSTFPARPLFETLISENKVADSVFSLQLSSSGGELFIGGTNEALYQQDTLTYMDVTRPGYWHIKMDDIQANGQTIMSGIDVILDTCANFIYGDRLRVYALHRALGGKPFKPGYFSFPCNANPEPSVTFTFGGRPFKIPIEKLRLGPISEGSPDCLSAIMSPSRTASYSFWNVGAPFLQGVYTVFDYGTGPQPTPRVGLAELA